MNSALTTYSSPEHGDLAQWLEHQLAGGATRLVLRQKSEDGGDQLVREFARTDAADASALADVIHRRAHEDGRHFRGRSLYGAFAYRDRDYLDRFFFAVDGAEDHAHFGHREANLSGVTTQLMRHNEANARLAIGQTLDVIGHYKALLAAREKRIEELETKYSLRTTLDRSRALPQISLSGCRLQVSTRRAAPTPRSTLADVLLRIQEQPKDKLAELLPHRWKDANGASFAVERSASSRDGP